MNDQPEFANSIRYYSRTSNGKYPMDAGKVRGAVLASETVADRMRAFRSRRLSDISSGEAPADFSEAATVVLHVLPLASFDVPEPGVDLEAARRFPQGFLPMSTGGDDYYNSSRFRSAAARPLDRDALVVPETMAPDAGIGRTEVERLMQPVLDRVWNASGYPKSDLYDSEGNWNAPR